MSDWTYSPEASADWLEVFADVRVALHDGGWGVVGASVAGRRRAVADAAPVDGVRARRELQDACMAAVSRRGELVVAVADGAGKARLGGYGARIPVATAVPLMTQVTYWSPAGGIVPYDSAHEWREAAYRVMRCVRAMLVRGARERGAAREELACTLTLVYANPVMVLAAQLGDGRAAALWNNGVWEAITMPQRGEYAGETQFLTSNGWRRDPMRVGFSMQMGCVEAIALLTDGCERVAFECQSRDGTSGRYAEANLPHAPFLTPNVRTLQRLLRPNVGHAVERVAATWEAFLREGTPELPALRDEPDDKTLLLAVRERGVSTAHEATSSTVPRAD